MKNEEIVRWYLEQAIKEMYPHKEVRPEVSSVLDRPANYYWTILRALELAVGDVG